MLCVSNILNTVAFEKVVHHQLNLKDLSNATHWLLTTVSPPPLRHNSHQAGDEQHQSDQIAEDQSMRYL